MNPTNDTGGTTLAAAVRQRVAAHPGQSGLHALADARDAMAARIVLADAAERSLDVQYFVWTRDMVGRALLERLFRAADRGVRVRMLLDDVGTVPSDEVLLAIDSHPNIEVRMFNPLPLRSVRRLGMAVSFARVNKRMHNKSFTVDGQVAIVGGRNIGDTYFGASSGANSADLDLAVIGPVVAEVTAEFELYWNHRTAVPIAKVSQKTTTPAEFAARREALLAHHAAATQSAYAEMVRDSEFAGQLRDGALTWYWSQATIVCDHPDKVITSSSERETHLAPKLRELVENAAREMFLVSPYFVPGKDGVALLAGARRRGLRVVVITNSLSSTNVLSVHSGYQRYRRALLKAGVELYEIKANARRGRQRTGGGWFGSKCSRGTGASLHAKVFAFDRRIGFVGSYNLDPRSSRLNTEMGVIVDCPELVQRLPEQTELDLDHTAYRVEIDGCRLVWVAHEGDTEVRHTTEPGTTAWTRLKVRMISWLPIEWLL
ncbi:MAG: phospholipase D family protein [Verrucomicrobiota bacterium]